MTYKKVLVRHDYTNLCLSKGIREESSNQHFWLSIAFTKQLSLQFGDLQSLKMKKLEAQ